MRRLSVRLFLSYLLVAAVGGATAFLVVRLSAPALFDRRMGPVGMMGRGQGQLRQTVAGAVTSALLLGLGTSLAAAAVTALFASRRLLRPVTDVRTATRRIARGDYTHPMPVPREPELAGLAGDVNAMAGSLAQTEARRVQLLSDVAHEMRTPLTVLKGRVDGLIDGVFQPTPDALLELGADLARLHRLADDLSALSRVQEHRLDLTLRQVDVTELVDAALRRAAPRLVEAGIEATGTHQQRPLLVRGDEQRLAQVLDNLVGNAIAAMPDGGTLRLVSRPVAGAAEVRVSDSGRGLAVEDLDRVFERFYRVDRHDGSTTTDGGSGIGLTVSRGIARAHGGSLTARSPGLRQGATFVLALPVPGPDPQPEPQLD